LWVAPIPTPVFTVWEATWKLPSLCCALPRHTVNRHPQRYIERMEMELHHQESSDQFVALLWPTCYVIILSHISNLSIRFYFSRTKFALYVSSHFIATGVDQGCVLSPLKDRRSAMILL